jgi:hypothetical protein
VGANLLGADESTNPNDLNTRSQGISSSNDFFDHAVAFCTKMHARPEAPFLISIRERLTAQVNKSGSKEELDRLEAFGVRRETLGVAAFILAFAPIIDRTLRSTLGSTNIRKRQYKALHKAINVLQELSSLYETASFGNPKEYFKDTGIPLPETVIQGLRNYAELLFVRERVLGALDAHSGEEIAKFTLAGTVRRLTGKYHDRDVSAIIAAVKDDPNYDENAHRVWRIRTYPRLDRKIFHLPMLLHALNSVLSNPEAPTFPTG